MTQIALLVLLVAFPEPESLVRGIYLNPQRARDRAYLNKVLSWCDSGYINTVVVDLKNDAGLLVYPSENETARKIKAVRGFIDLDTLVKLTREHNLKLIARLVVFKDDRLAKYKNFGIKHARGGLWRDDGGYHWVNPYSEEVWEYNLSIVRELLNKGIKSIQFDYVRFPTDGNLSTCRYPVVKGERDEAICGFLKRAQEIVKAQGGEIGACVFGYTIWKTLKKEGQDIAKMSRHVDYLYPMLYPSHFSPNFKREIDDVWRSFVIYYESLARVRPVVAESAGIVPYIQGFDYRSPQYGADYIYAQMFGSVVGGADGFIVWNSRGAYGFSAPALRWARSAERVRPVPNLPDIRTRSTPRQYTERN